MTFLDLEIFPCYPEVNFWMTEYVPEVVARNTGFIGTVKTTNTVFNNILVLKKGRVQREDPKTTNSSHKSRY